jgi:hypothetical protein
LLAHDHKEDAARALLPLIGDPEFRERIRREIDREWE